MHSKLMLKYKILLFALFFFFQLQSWSQKWITVLKDKDSVNFASSQILHTKDSVFFSVNDTFIILKKGDKYRIRNNPYSASGNFYDSLQVRSYRNRVSREIYNLLMRSTPIEIQDTSNFNKSENVFLPYKGLKIKSIRLVGTDVIEGSVHDTLIEAKTFLGKSANNLHINSWEYIIFNNLTIREGDQIDPVKLADNERILREAPFIEDARIQVSPNPLDSSMADLIVITKDKFSIGIGFDYGGIDRSNIYLYDKNFFGTGHEMRHYLIYNAAFDPEYGYAFKYRINNVLHSFTSVSFEYENSWERKFRGISVNKIFLTKETKFAGGGSIYELADSREKKINDSVLIVPYKTFIQDYWIGRAFSLFNNKEVKFNSSIRFANANFSERPIVSEDTNFFYHDRSLVLGSFSLIKRNYYLSSLVFGFGVTEDIPYGYKIDFLMGYENDQFVKRPYFGGAISFGEYFKFPGYMMFNAEIGSFFINGTGYDQVLKLGFQNIGNLHHMNRYSIRNFFEIDFQSGKNMSDPESKAVINGKWSTIVSGLNKEGLKGTQKITAGFESILFTPWYLYGFKFAIPAYVNLGWVTKEENFRKNVIFYGNIGLGLRIKNESWVFETITIGFAWLLSAPTGSDNIGYILDGSDPRIFRNLNPDKPEIIRMDQSPNLFLY